MSMESPHRFPHLMTVAARLDRLVENIERAALAGGVLLMAATSIANVVGRNLFGASIDFAEELNQSLLVLITFMGIGYGVRRARHIRMSAIYDQLTGRWRKGFMVMITLGTALLLAVLAWYAAVYVGNAWRIGRVTPALQIPLWAVYLVVPLGLALGALQFLLAGVRNLTTPGVHLAWNRTESFGPGDGEVPP